MPYFIDTNIALGYTIIHDKWHEFSKDFIDSNTNDAIFWSNLVQKEYDDKLFEIENSIDFFLKRTKLLLKNNKKDFLNYSSFENYIMKRTKKSRLDSVKKQKILEKFWKKFNFKIGFSDTIYLKFNEFVNEFEKVYAKQDKKLNSLLTFHDCGLNNYLKYLDIATKLYKWGIHKPDCKIITDAHDCGIYHENLRFITTDLNMLRVLFEHDPSFMKIIEFKSCY